MLSLGSNLGDRFAHLRAAVAGFADALVAASPVYETAPWGGVEQDDFLNAVLLVDDPATDAWGWLRRGQALEDAAGRVRDVRWGPRTLDVDVVTVGPGAQRPTPSSLLPHPGTAGARHRAAAVARRRPGRRAARPRPGRRAARRARPRRRGTACAAATTWCSPLTPPSLAGPMTPAPPPARPRIPPPRPRRYAPSFPRCAPHPRRGRTATFAVALTWNSPVVKTVDSPWKETRRCDAHAPAHLLGRRTGRRGAGQPRRPADLRLAARLPAARRDHAGRARRRGGDGRQALRARIRREPGTTPVQPLVAARAVLVAKASSVAGAVVAGAWLGCSSSPPRRPERHRPRRATRSRGGRRAGLRARAGRRGAVAGALLPNARRSRTARRIGSGAMTQATGVAP